MAVLDWLEPCLDDEDRTHLSGIADEAIGAILGIWRTIRNRKKSLATARTGLGWLGDEPYLRLAERSLADKVIKPLEARGLAVSRAPLPPGVLARL